jgi:predicted nucleic acid-binding protein
MRIIVDTNIIIDILRNVKASDSRQKIDGRE